MKRIYSILIFIVAFLQQSYGQCDINVQEAVRNGDFNAGFIPGDFRTGHTNAGSIVDGFIGEEDHISGCNWVTGGQYYISTNEVSYSCGWANYVGTPFNPDYGRRCSE